MQNNKRIVIKIGTKCLTSKDRALDKDRVKDIVGQIADIQDSGFRAIMVTSGAIGAGMWIMGLK
ncbi:MAG TPA: glutamate 5-kinase, partial [Candidatus Omnitrophota bacterium]|nr:glutamate 5-kinase [Candidatus Omnitrophota bacterium]